MNNPRPWIFLTLASLCLGLPFRDGFAGEGFFSEDGKTVTMVSNRSTTALMQVDLATGKITAAPLPPELKDEYIESVARGAEGEALFLAKEAVWVWTPGSDTPVKRVCTTSPVVGATDLFVATMPGTPLTDCLFVSGNESADATSMGSFFGRLPGAKNPFVSVFCRRVSSAMGGVFAPDGRFFFISEGDLWEGGIQRDDDPAIERLGTLIGARIAPLAISNTDDANGGGLWAASLAPAGEWIYVQLRGRHMATIVRVPIPAKTLYGPGVEDFPTVRGQLDAMKDALTTTEIVADDLGDVFGFCATETGGTPQVFYCTLTDAEGKGPAMLLSEGTGEARVVGYLPLN